MSFQFADLLDFLIPLSGGIVLIFMSKRKVVEDPLNLEKFNPKIFKTIGWVLIGITLIRLLFFILGFTK